MGRSSKTPKPAPFAVAVKGDDCWQVQLSGQVWTPANNRKDAMRDAAEFNAAAEAWLAERCAACNLHHMSITINPERVRTVRIKTAGLGDFDESRVEAEFDSGKKPKHVRESKPKIRSFAKNPDGRCRGGLRYTQITKANCRACCGPICDEVRSFLGMAVKRYAKPKPKPKSKRGAKS